MGDSDVASFAAFGRLGPGAKLGPYTIVRAAGRGGMAMVWEAHRHDEAKTRVALKTMLPTVALEPKLAKSFATEARLAERLDGDHVCRVLDHGEVDGVVFLATEWVDGGSLETLRRSTNVPYGIAVRIAADVAHGLHLAHRANDESGAALDIVHRDVSPQNILVGRDGRAKIADFGIARVRASIEGTTSKLVKGKVLYMAPEQAYCEPVDPRTDVFALGIVLYQVITNRSPYEGADTDVAILARIASPTPIAWPAEDNCPAALRELVTRAIAKDKEARFRDMGEMATALEALAKDLADATHASVRTWVGDASEAHADAKTQVTVGGDNLRALRISAALAAAVVIALVFLVAREPSQAAREKEPNIVASTSAAVVVTAAAPSMREPVIDPPIAAIASIQPAVKAEPAPARRAAAPATSIASALPVTSAPPIASAKQDAKKNPFASEVLQTRE